MTTKKKSSSPKSKSLSEPAGATKTVKAEKAAKKAPQAASTLPPNPVVPDAVPADLGQPVAVPALATAPAETATERMMPTVGMFQKRLYEAGCYGGHWDGHYGPLTRQAVRMFQQSKGLPVDGEPTPETLTALGL